MEKFLWLLLGVEQLEALGVFDNTKKKKSLQKYNFLCYENDDLFTPLDVAF